MRLCWFLWCWLLVLPTQADVFKPAYLQLKQIDTERFDVLWKVPALDAETTLKTRPIFPAGTEELKAVSSIYTMGAVTQRWRVLIPGGLEDKPIVFSNLFTTGIDVLVRIERSDGSEQLERILPIDPQFIFTASLGDMEVVNTYTVLGIEHILAGYDHLLFVLGLLLIVNGHRRLLITITAFTVAHSITLALATFEIIHLPISPLESIIALSIVFLAAEILHQQNGENSLASRQPWLVAFAFGLLHGLGFASALAEVGLPETAIPLALLFFNVGVEIGQLLFIGCVLLLIALVKKLFKNRLNLPRSVTISAYLIGSISSFWVVERIMSF